MRASAEVHDEQDRTSAGDEVTDDSTQASLLFPGVRPMMARRGLASGRYAARIAPHAHHHDAVTVTLVPLRCDLRFERLLTAREVMAPVSPSD